MPLFQSTSSQPHRLSLARSRNCAVALATLLLLGACAATQAPEPVVEPLKTVDGGVTVPADLKIVDPRFCATLAVYEFAQHNDWGLRTTIASTVLNGFRATERVPDCSAGVAIALTQDFSQERWQAALNAVDAVIDGSYSVSPDACARATAVVPLHPVVDAGTPPAARARCVIYDLAFLEVRP
ncbi:hypothetical protein [Stenotrophomonas sp. SY1]|uniref:hypothetical protein n=1 Tax=Stenotrophomonas sp. SY1 TaxID=477235 RepID=UPI001E5D5994|nr:hypothetical protein [Stenotrophomonas sp. SY1]MCD9086217.1 hypothetical protein [Stenotrophomonas sp. SY1]